MRNLLILLFFFLSIQTLSQIKSGSSIELGYEDRIFTFFNNVGINQTSYWLNNKEFAKLDMNVSYKKFSIYTDVKTYFAFERIDSYMPFQAEYRLGINYQIKSFLFSAEHMCSHSIESKVFQEAYNKFSVKIKLF